jgi:FAD/FMN-containing dehydrogenase
VTLIDITTGRVADAATAEMLRQSCGGATHLPGDAGYDAARAAWQANIDQRPAAVVYPADEAEVAATVRAAAAAGLRVAAQGTGHNASPLPALHDTVLVRTSALTEVHIDPQARKARVGSGALWIDVVEPAAAHGLAALHGSSPDVGVAGYSLGGGMGWYARKHGLQTNHLTAVELITADGEFVRADADHHPELFWAIRGGGGNFGVVTTLEFDLFPITSAYAGWLVWDWQDAAEVLPAWLEWTRSCPDEVTTALRILQLPPIDAIPEPLRGRNIVAIDGAVLGDDATGAELIAPLRALGPDMDTFTRMPAAALARLHGDPEGPTPAVSDTANLGAIDDVDAFAQAFVGAAGPGSGSSLLLAELRQLGGALGRPDPRGGALPMLTGQFVLFGLGMVFGPDDVARVAGDSERLVAACAQWGNGRQYLNFAERRIDTSTAFDAPAWQRLSAVRSAYDPDGLFVANHAIG